MRYVKVLWMLYILRRLAFIDLTAVFGEAGTLKSKPLKAVFLLPRVSVNALNRSFCLLYSLFFLQFFLFNAFTFSSAVANCFRNSSLNMFISCFNSYTSEILGSNVGAVPTASNTLQNMNNNKNIECMLDVGFTSGYLNRIKISKWKYQRPFRKCTPFETGHEHSHKIFFETVRMTLWKKTFICSHCDISLLFAIEIWIKVNIKKKTYIRQQVGISFYLKNLFLSI